MSDPTGVNPQIIDTINQVQEATMSPQVVRTSGAGKSYQAVAQSAALAVQDAVDAVRSSCVLASTATGVAFAQMLAAPSSGADAKPYEAVVAGARTTVKAAIEDFETIGAAAARALAGFQSG
jgi:hypothetical protein